MLFRRLAVISIALTSLQAWGHSQLLVSPHPDDPHPETFNSPRPRVDSDSIKDQSPCGPDGGKKAPVSTYLKGSTLNLQWKETINHTGVWRIDFSSDNDKTFTRLVPDMVDPDDVGIVRSIGKWYHKEVPLPDIVCDNCTIRLTQSMGALDDNNDYFSCADIKLVASLDTNTTPPANTTQSTHASTADNSKQPAMGGCGLISGFFPGGRPPGAGSGTALLLLALPLFFWRRLRFIERRS